MTTTAPVFSATTRFLPLWTREGISSKTGRMHLAKVKTTKKPLTEAWCGRTYWVDSWSGFPVVTGEAALLFADADEQPTCALCLARVGAWEWDW